MGEAAGKSTGNSALQSTEVEKLYFFDFSVDNNV